MTLEAALCGKSPPQESCPSSVGAERPRQASTLPPPSPAHCPRERQANPVRAQRGLPLKRRWCGRAGRQTCWGEMHRLSLLPPLTLDSHALSLNSAACVLGSLEGCG